MYENSGTDLCLHRSPYFSNFELACTFQQGTIVSFLLKSIIFPFHFKSIFIVNNTTWISAFTKVHTEIFTNDVTTVMHAFSIIIIFLLFLVLLSCIFFFYLLVIKHPQDTFSYDFYCFLWITKKNIYFYSVRTRQSPIWYWYGWWLYEFFVNLENNKNQSFRWVSAPNRSNNFWRPLLQYYFFSQVLFHVI